MSKNLEEEIFLGGLGWIWQERLGVTDGNYPAEPASQSSGNQSSLTNVWLHTPEQHSGMFYQHLLLLLWLWQETGKQNLCQGAGKSRLELPRVRRTRGGKGAQEGNQFLKSHLKMETMTENVPGVLVQLMVWLGRRSLCPGPFSEPLATRGGAEAEFPS